MEGEPPLEITCSCHTRYGEGEGEPINRNGDRGWEKHMGWGKKKVLILRPVCR